MQRLFQVAAFAAFVALGSAASDELTNDNDEVAVNRQDSAKLFSAFQLVRFPNDACVGTNSRNGTCYTSEECTTKGGTSGGSCASGFGVCCTFSVTCGQKSSENVTYWDSASTISAGNCAVTICKANDNICQLRLDFTNFVITGPNTISTSVSKVLGGTVLSGGASVGTPSSACNTDLFTVSTDAGKAVPRVCGTLSGEHMYVAASEACNVLNFNFGSTARGVATFATRSWKISVTQYECDYNNLAPEGCTQYFFGATTGTVKSYNFDANVHLADQRQNICFRQEKGICRMCFASADTEFLLSGDKTVGIVIGPDSPCAYGQGAADTLGFDCLILPGATIKANGKVAPSMQGGLLGLLESGGSTAGATLCTRRTPFHIEFLSDSFEFLDELGLRGFRLSYFNIANSC